VPVRVHGRQWVTREQAPGSFAVPVRGMTAFPFAIMHKILRGEPYNKSRLVRRLLPAVAARTQAGTPGEPPASAR
jgi:hypothetical protein